MLPGTSTEMFKSIKSFEYETDYKRAGIFFQTPNMVRKLHNFYVMANFFNVRYF